MLATVAGVLSTFKLRQTKNPIPYLWHLGRLRALHLPWLLQEREFVELE